MMVSSGKPISFPTHNIANSLLSPNLLNFSLIFSLIFVGTQSWKAMKYFSFFSNIDQQVL